MLECIYPYFFYIFNSIAMNYKSWIVLLLSLLVLCDFRPIILITFIIGMVSSHLIHYWHHFEHSYPHNIIHDYHHRFNLPFNHIIQILLEFVSIAGIIPFKYYVLDWFPDWSSLLSLIDDWIVIYYYLFYTTIHNINYSIFHVNHVHEIHHREFVKNMGPDICDIMFCTKYRPEEGLENTDHYIPNIIFCTLVVLSLKYVWNHSTKDSQEWYVFFSKWFFNLCLVFLLVTSVCLYKMDIDQAFERDVHQVGGRKSPLAYGRPPPCFLPC